MWLAQTFLLFGILRHNTRNTHKLWLTPNTLPSADKMQNNLLRNKFDHGEILPLSCLVTDCLFIMFTSARLLMYSVDCWFLSTTARDHYHTRARRFVIFIHARIVLSYRDVTDWTVDHHEPDVHSTSIDRCPALLQLFRVHSYRLSSVYYVVTVSIESRAERWWANTRAFLYSSNVNVVGMRARIWECRAMQDRVDGKTLFYLIDRYSVCNKVRSRV